MDTLAKNYLLSKPQGFDDSKKEDHVYQQWKALYRLKQASRAWYERLSTFPVENNFEKGEVDTTLFTKRNGDDILLIQIYIDDIIFDSTNEDTCKGFANIMKSKFEMSMIRELNFFLRLQVKQLKEGTFIILEKYVKKLGKKFGMENS